MSIDLDHVNIDPNPTPREYVEGNTATASQISFIKNLISQKGSAGDDLAEGFRAMWRKGIFTKAEASKCINSLLDLPDSELPEIESGFYLKDGQYFQVQSSKAGRLYAKEFVGNEWVYQGVAPIRGLTSDHLISQEEAAEFGHKFGKCMMCGRVLTNPVSIEAGIGPICADKQGWVI